MDYRARLRQQNQSQLQGQFDSFDLPRRLAIPAAAEVVEVLVADQEMKIVIETVFEQSWFHFGRRLVIDSPFQPGWLPKY